MLEWLEKRSVDNVFSYAICLLEMGGGGGMTKDHWIVWFDWRGMCTRNGWIQRDLWFVAVEQKESLDGLVEWKEYKD